MNTFDVVVIGGGPGGMTAGMMLRQAGKSVAVIQEAPDSLGGICLNRGCMPTKSLLKAATAYRYARQCEKYGLDMLASPVNLERLRAVADEDLARLREMVEGRFAGAEIPVFRGRGSFQSAHELVVVKSDGSTEQVRGDTIIIATGSKPAELSFAPFDGRQILSSDQILTNTELPKKLLIVGGGAMGCEFATLYSTFGSEVLLVEASATLLPHEDQEAGKMLQAAFESQGILVKTGTVVEQLTVEDGSVRVQYGDGSSPDSVDKVLVSVGRKPNIEGLNLEAAGVETENGALKVNEWMQTSVDHIYAAGDAIGGLMLAHAAEKEGRLLAENLSRETRHPLDETAVPRVAFCCPEVAAVGVNAAGDGVRTFTMPQVPNGRSVLDKVAPAFVKLFVEEETAVVAGAVLIGEAATEWIHEYALAVENRLTLHQIGNTAHAHPSHAENAAIAVHHAMACSSLKN